MKWQGPKEHVVDNVVCGCVCPDSERQGENDGYRERGVPAKEMKGEANIKGIHERNCGCGGRICNIALKHIALKHILKSELYLPHIVRCGRYLCKRRRRRRSVGGPGPHVGESPLRMIERVERFKAELQALAFRNPEILNRGKIHIPARRSDH